MNVTAQDYLKRMDYKGGTAPTVENLRDLVLTHRANVPFENMGMLDKAPLELSKEFLWKRMVSEHRGGICHELNNSFCYLLQDLGYEVSLHTAMVDTDDDELEHTQLQVMLEGEPWMVDVGCGGLLAPPLRLNYDGAQEGFGCTYRISAEENGTHILWKTEGDKAEEVVLTRFPQPRHRNDVLIPYLRYAKEGATIFSSHYVVIRTSPTFKYSLIKEKLTIVEGGEEKVTEATTEEVRREMLRTYFGVVLD